MSDHPEGISYQEDHNHNNNFYNNQNNYEKNQLTLSSDKDNIQSPKLQYKTDIPVKYNNETYEERTKYNKKKSTFYDHSTTTHSIFPFSTSTYDHNKTNFNKNNDTTISNTKLSHEYKNNISDINMYKNDGTIIDIPNNNTNEATNCYLNYGDNGYNDYNKDGNSTYDTLHKNCGLTNCYKEYDPNINYQIGSQLHNKNYDDNCKNKILAENMMGLKEEGINTITDVGVNNINVIDIHTTKYDEEKSNDLNKNMHYKIDDRSDSFYVNRVKDLNHTKIFYENNSYNGSKTYNSKKKNINSDFVPKYKQLSSKEALYNNLIGNDNITVLAANQIKLDLSKLPQKDMNLLPDVYPFHLSAENKKNNNNTINNNNNNKNIRLEKLYPTNYNYINNYNTKNADITLEERRNYMNSSHIFEYDSEKYVDVKNEQNKNLNMITNITNYKLYNIDIEKDEKRKQNPMYTDLFGRKTPDVNKNMSCSKNMSTDINNNSINLTKDCNNNYDKSYDTYANYLKEHGKESFHRVSKFSKDSFDCRKQLQAALEKGSKACLQVNLKSYIQDDTNTSTSTSNNNDNIKLDVAYFSLQNINDSITDDEIKQVVKNSQSYLVNYQSEYDVLSNRKKGNAKLCIKHPNGKEGINLVITLLSQLGIKAHVLY
ncbi:conserved protein, unknown function [Hepatocystis sp. ex Piliocolobus tephrosceles]|nr:conserved protein, unknown function [Hepatocystis sp. ex Piliocolobus tephrosceles]